MENFARIIDNVAVDTSNDPGNHFHPDIAAQFELVPDEVQAGWRLEDGVWSAPIQSEPAPVSLSYPKVGPIHFQMLFTTQEGEKADELKETDKTLARFWKLIDDPRTDVVDLSLQSVQNAVEYTLTVVKAAGVDLDVQERKAQILTGVLQ